MNDFLFYIKGIEIDGDRVVEKRQLRQILNNPSPGSLRSPLQQNQVVVAAVVKESEFRGALICAIPDVLLNAGETIELGQRVVSEPLPERWINRVREMQIVFLIAHGPDTAAASIKE
jgi:hypothetical protein